MRQLRKTQWIRDLVKENSISIKDIVMPIFVIEGTDRIEPINALPNINRYSLDKALDQIKKAESLGIPAVAPFANVEIDKRDKIGSHGLEKNNVINVLCEEVKKLDLNIGVISDPALDPFTDHGHDGILEGETILNDESVAQIAKVALIQAQSGADIIAPSDMMDGRVAAIRAILDDNGFEDIPILSYAAKFASAFYGPYREAIGTDKTLKGDKATYYLSASQRREAIEEAIIDVEEGASMVMIKPALPYLDIIRDVRENVNCPVFGYQVSGEYAMIEAAKQNKWINGEKAMWESIMAIKRAGAKGIFTYYAMKIAEELNS